jgi:anti-anti-sigma factor
VSFLASIGIRALITAAKSVQQRGGRMVLLVGGNETVHTTLSVTGIDAILPMFSSAADAQAAATA